MLGAWFGCGLVWCWGEMTTGERVPLEDGGDEGNSTAVDCT